MNPRLAAIAALALVLAACGPADDTSDTPTATSAAPTSGDLDLNGLKTGTKPKIAWAKGSRLNGDPAKEVLPQNVDEFVETKQLLVMRDVDGNVFAYSPDGPTSTTPIGTATGGLATNEERNLVAWIAPDGSPTVLQEGEAKPAVLQKQDGVTEGDAVAVFGRDCFNGPETVEGAGCSVYFRSRGTDEPTPYVASNHGFVNKVGSGIRGLQDVHPKDQTLVGWTEVKDDMTTCSRATNETIMWKSCAFMPLSYSPDGSHLLATHSIGYEGLGTGQLTVLDATTGKSKLTLKNNETTQAAIVDMVWEDDTHVLAIVTQKLDWAIVRVGIDGSMEFAGEPVHSTKELEGIPFHLAVQP